jgi:hypothetical protein
MQAALRYFEVLSRNSFKEVEENNGNFSHDSQWCPGRDSNPIISFMA